MSSFKRIAFFLIVLLNAEPNFCRNTNNEMSPSTSETNTSHLPRELLDLLSTDDHLSDDPFLAEIIEEERLMNISKNYDNTEDNTNAQTISPTKMEPEITETRTLTQSKTESSPHKTSTISPIQQGSDPDEVIEDIIVPRSSQPQTLSFRPLSGVFSSVGHKVKDIFHKEKPIQRSPISTPSSHLEVPSGLTDDDIEGEIITSKTEDTIACNKTDTKYEGNCYHVLQQGPCGEGEWLVEDEITKAGKCVANKCGALKVQFGDICVDFGSQTYCHPGMRVYVYKNGKTECDCKEGHLFNEKDGNCYAALRKGPCSTHETFKLNKNKNETICEPNPCLTDGYVCNAPRCPRQRNCVELHSTCPQGGIYAVNTETFTVECAGPSPVQVVGNVPTLVCAPGSRRDILGSCRKPSDITFS